MDALAIFTKYPEKGKVKTRLAVDIGEENAAKLQIAFVKDLLILHDNKEYDLFICFSPKEKEDDMRKLYGTVNYIPQEGKDLGERMKNCFDLLLNEFQKVIIIGSDIPDILERNIKKALALLNDNEAVLGPAKDGGYYLIGINKGVDTDIFSGINWSTDKVLEQQKRNLEEKGIGFALLEVRSDVDTVEDLERLKHDIHKEACPNTSNVIYLL